MVVFEKFMRAKQKNFERLTDDEILYQLTKENTYVHVHSGVLRAGGEEPRTLVDLASDPETSVLVMYG